MSSQEPQYLLYCRDQYRGPFAESILVEEINNKRIGKDLTVWNESLNQWVAIGDSPIFSCYQSLFVEQTNLSEDIEDRNNSYLFKNEYNGPSILSEEPDEDDFYDRMMRRNSRFKELQEVTVSSSGDSQAMTISEPSGDSQPQTTKSPIFWLRTGVIGLLVIGIGLAVFNSYTQRAELQPLLNRLDASYLEITQAQEFILQGGKQEPLVFLEKTSPQAPPQMRVFVDFPDHSRVLMSLKGIRKTLVGALAAEAYVDFNVKDLNGGTPPILNQEGEPLTPGYYQVQLTCLNCTGDNAVPKLLKQPIALGVENQASYLSELKSFHALLRSQADSELIEIKEILSILHEFVNSQNLSSQQKKIQSQLKNILFAIDPSVARSSYVFGNTYLHLKKILQAIDSQQWSRAQQDLKVVGKTLERLSHSVQSGHFLNPSI